MGLWDEIQSCGCNTKTRWPLWAQSRLMLVQHSDLLSAAGTRRSSHMENLSLSSLLSAFVRFDVLGAVIAICPRNGGFEPILTDAAVCTFLR